MIDRMCQVLHTKAEDIRIHDFTDEDHPQLLDDEDKTIVDLHFTDSHKLLVESENLLRLCVCVCTCISVKCGMHSFSDSLFTSS